MLTPKYCQTKMVNNKLLCMQRGAENVDAIKKHKMPVPNVVPDTLHKKLHISHYRAGKSQAVSVHWTVLAIWNQFGLQWSLQNTPKQKLSIINLLYTKGSRKHRRDKNTKRYPPTKTENNIHQQTWTINIGPTSWQRSNASWGFPLNPRPRPRP